jgi:phosphate transport system protein
MASRLEEMLGGIGEKISHQAAKVEKMVELSLAGLHNRCLNTVDEIKVLELDINENEISIEDECLRLLALQSPVAVDLRRVATTFKINGDLERIGDLALNLSERAESLTRYPSIEIPDKLETMVKISLQMLHDANVAFADCNLELAQSVCERDDEVDQLNSHLISEIVSKMKDDPNDVEGLLHIFSASRIIERIGDHATNIAEDVIYLVEGEIKRHQYKLVR